MLYTFTESHITISCSLLFDIYKYKIFVIAVNQSGLNSKCENHDKGYHILNFEGKLQT